MANKKLSERQQMKVRSEREQHVYKRDDMIQKGKHKLSVQEQKCILYAISKIKPDDSVFQEYNFDIKDFFNVCGFQGESYTKMRAILKGLTDKSWWAETAPKVKSTVRWFNKVKIDENTNDITIRFDDDMMPFLLKLVGQGEFYTHYELRYILALRSQYSIRLYEILKSYQKNNRRWFFDIDELKELLNCEKYVDFGQFRRRVLEPAVEEINECTDIDVEWDVEKEGRKVTRVMFFMLKKAGRELSLANLNIDLKLNGRETYPSERALAAP